MNKYTKRIYKRLNKDLDKNRKKLVEICEKYIATQNDILLPDIEYFSQLVWNDTQDLLLINIATAPIED